MLTKKNVNSGYRAGLEAAVVLSFDGYGIMLWNILEYSI